MYRPKPGELDTPIDIYRTVNAINDNGYAVPTDELVCHVWANVQDASSQYARAADADVSTRGVKFIIRTRSDVREGQVIVYNGRRQNIETIGTFGRLSPYMELFTKSVEGVK